MWSARDCFVNFVLVSHLVFQLYILRYDMKFKYIFQFLSSNSSRNKKRSGIGLCIEAAGPNRVISKAYLFNDIAFENRGENIGIDGIVNSAYWSWKW